MEQEHAPMLAVALGRALNRRIDIKKANVSLDISRTSLVIEVTDRVGRTTRRDVTASKVYDDGRPMGEIIADWFGKEPDVSGKRDAAWHADRAETFGAPPAVCVARAMKGHVPRVAEKNKLHSDHPQAQGSALDWDRGDPDVSPPAAIPDPTPAGDDSATYVDPITNERRPVMTRAQMNKLGMTKDQRHEQYRRQGGPHPSDL